MESRRNFLSIRTDYDKHTKKIADYFKHKLHEIDSPVTPDNITTVFICFTNRSGSNLVSSYLASTGFLNTAKELFDHTVVERISAKQSIQYFSEYCKTVKQTHQKNNYLVVKVASSQLAHLASLGFLDNIFYPARFIHVERSDVLAQAISFEIAFQNKQWTSGMEPSTRDSELKYVPGNIETRLQYICSSNYEFSLFFAINGIKKFHVNYEHFVRAPEAITMDIYKWLGLREMPIKKEKVLQKQDRSMKDLWRQRFLQEETLYTSLW